MKKIKSFKGKLYLVPFTLILLLLNLKFSYGDEPLGIFIERIDDAKGISICKICGRTINSGNIHMEAEKILRELIKDNLREMGVNFIEEKGTGRYLHVLLYRFIERKGGNLAVEKPASVGFHMHLIDRDNVLKKTYVFEETQQALSENLLSIGKFLRRRAKWITARELAEEGVNEGLQRLMEDLR